MVKKVELNKHWVNYIRLKPSSIMNNFTFAKIYPMPLFILKSVVFFILAGCEQKNKVVFEDD